jgi:hypothetical protein
MSPTSRLALSCLAALCAAGCIVAERAPEPPAEARLSEAAAGRPAQAAVLYARDGTPVPLAAQPAQDGAGAHLPRPSGESRTYLLELYQETVDAKEALGREVRALHAELDALRQGLAARERELENERAHVESLEAERLRLEEESRELAARLVTAQIRRLEAERLLLEAKIEWLRAQELGRAGAPPALPQTPPARDGGSR